MALVIIALGAVGFALNQKYSGRALPYSYIGNISIGGLTAAEIKTALDLQASETMVTFTEGGLTRTVSADMFSTQFDTEKAAIEHMRRVEPTTPLVSLKGKSPRITLPYDSYKKWKKD